MKQISALLAGLIFGLGLTISEMLNPAKVLAFLDLFGDWDPSLVFVMGSALVVTAIGYRLAWRRGKPVFEPQFQIPDTRQIDARLATGSVLFGIGWGLVGLCPGPALAALSIGGGSAILFLLAMVAGILLFELFNRTNANSQPA